MTGLDAARAWWDEVEWKQVRPTGLLGGRDERFVFDSRATLSALFSTQRTSLVPRQVERSQSRDYYDICDSVRSFDLLEFLGCCSSLKERPRLVSRLRRE